MCTAWATIWIKFKFYKWIRTETTRVAALWTKCSWRPRTSCNSIWNLLGSYPSHLKLRNTLMRLLKWIARLSTSLRCWWPTAVTWMPIQTTPSQKLQPVARVSKSLCSKCNKLTLQLIITCTEKWCSRTIIILRVKHTRYRALKEQFFKSRRLK